MPSAPQVFRLFGVAALLTAAGCVSPYSYPPYGAGGYPAYSPPLQQPGAYMVPGTTLGQPTLGGQVQNWQQPATRSATEAPGSTGSRTYDANRSGLGDHLVPDQGYGDAKLPDRGSASLPARIGSPVSYEDGPRFALEEVETGASRQVEATPFDFDPASIDDEGFEEPIPFQPASSSRVVSASAAVEGRNQPNPFDYDRDSYRWLRGTVEYDEREQAWSLMYDLAPDAEPYGGSLVLLDHPQLNTLQNDDVVIVEGRVDTAVRDARGKPCFRIDQILKLRPRG